jgi:hypothetical protein
MRKEWEGKKIKGNKERICERGRERVKRESKNV